MSDVLSIRSALIYHKAFLFYMSWEMRRGNANPVFAIALHMSRIVGEGRNQPKMHA